MSGTAIALIPATTAERWKYAETMADANLLPDVFRRRPADVFYAVEYGAMLGLSPIAALTGIHVIEGKPSASASLMAGLVQAQGHKVRTSVTGTVSAGDITATCTVIRADDPDHPFTSTWDLDRALRAELIDRLEVTPEGKTVVVHRTRKGLAGNWQKYTESMLKARAKSEACRDAAEDALFGLHYTPEELGAEVNEDGEPVEVTVAVVDDAPAETGSRAKPPTQRGRPAPAPAEPKPAAAPPAVEVVDAEIVDDPRSGNAAESADGQAQQAADFAANCRDADLLVEKFRQATERKVVTVPVTIHPDLRAICGVKPDAPLNLGSWLIAASTFVRAGGSLTVTEAAALASEEPNPVHDMEENH